MSWMFIGLFCSVELGLPCCILQ